MSSFSKKISGLPPVSLFLLSTLFLSFFCHQIDAVTTIHYYKIPSCNAGTDVGVYNAPTTSTVSDSACHDVSRGSNGTAKALYINGLDDGCAVLTYTSSSCEDQDRQRKVAEKGECYYLDGFGEIGSWKAVCGGNLTVVEQGSGSGSGSANSNATASVVGAGGTGVASSTVSSVSSNAKASGTANSGIRAVSESGVSVVGFVLAVFGCSTWF